MSLPKETLINLYRTMVRIRKFEEATRKLSREKKSPGPAAPYTGEEAIAAGVCAHLTKEDYLSSTHRPLGHCVAKGADLNRLMAELCAKVTGFNKGKAGAYHVADASIGLIGANGIVGASVPMAAGYALACQLKKNNNVSVCFFGEGASNQGVVQETLNLAAVWMLPLIFVCENSAPEGSQMLGHMMNYPQLSIEDISTRGAAYNLPSAAVDGSDALAVYEAAEKAVKRAREGGVSTLLEFKTYQYRGPFRGEDAVRLEEDWRKKDPIQKFKRRLLESHVISESDLGRVEREEERAVEEAVQFALSSPEPSLEEAFKDIFVREE